MELNHPVNQSRPHSSPLPRITSPKFMNSSPIVARLSGQSSKKLHQTDNAEAKTECLAMYEFNRIIHGKVKRISEYFLFLTSAVNGHYHFESIEKLFENPIFFSKPTRADHRHYAMLQWLGSIISDCGYSAEAWFQSVSLDNEKIFFSEFSASVLLLSVQCRAPIKKEPYVKELFSFIVNSNEQLFFTRHNFASAFRRMRLSNNEMIKMNHTATIISELSEFLKDRNLSLRDFRLRIVQQQILQEKSNSPANLYHAHQTVGAAGSHGAENSGHHHSPQHYPQHTHHNNAHRHGHDSDRHRHRDQRGHDHHGHGHDNSSPQRNHHHGRRHYYSDPAVQEAMTTIGIAECENLLTVIFNYQGKKSGTMPSLSRSGSKRLDHNALLQLSQFPQFSHHPQMDSPMRGSLHHSHEGPALRISTDMQRPNTSPAIEQTSAHETKNKNKSKIASNQAKSSIMLPTSTFQSRPFSSSAKEFSRK